jgi:hypothetical protein
VLTPLMAPLDGARASWLPGYRVKMSDGPCLEASERRLHALREGQGGAMPGKAVVVYAPAHGVGRDGFPWDDGHAQARSLWGLALETVRTGDRWRQDRNCCPCALLGAIDCRGACCITRPQERLPCAPVHVRRSVGRIEPGHVAEQRGQVREAQGGTPLGRRLRVQLAQATRDGEKGLDILPQLPLRTASATRVARF